MAMKRHYVYIHYNNRFCEIHSVIDELSPIHKHTIFMTTKEIRGIITPRGRLQFIDRVSIKPNFITAEIFMVDEYMKLDHEMFIPSDTLSRHTYTYKAREETQALHIIIYSNTPLPIPDVLEFIEKYYK